MCPTPNTHVAICERCMLWLCSPAMAEFYQGPNNSAQLKAVTIILPIVATLLVIWRISWRAWKRVIVLSDYLLVLGLVGYCFCFYALSIITTTQCLSLCLAGFNLDRKFLVSIATSSWTTDSVLQMGLWISQSRSTSWDSGRIHTKNRKYLPLLSLFLSHY